MGYIYKIVNDINDRVYVGKTSGSIKVRWKEHKKDAKRNYGDKNRPLYKAIKKYGVEHFTVEKIGEYPNEMLNEMEIYWIDYYHGYTDGYNATKGGDGKPLFDYEIIKNELMMFPYPKKIAEKIGCGVDVVINVAKANNINIRNYNTDKTKIKIECYDKNTEEFIAEFESFHDAAKWCHENGRSSGKNISGDAYHISVASRPNSNRKTAYGYIWKVVNKDE